MTALVERHGLTQPAARAARFTAMVVVASPFVRESIVRNLQSLGARDVVEAASLAEARARARTDSPRDLCVVDSSLAIWNPVLPPPTTATVPSGTPLGRW